MTRLLEIRNRIFRVYGQLETYLFPIVKFLLALAIFFIINHNIGYMEKISSVPMTFLLALVCCILPVNGTICIAAVVILLDMYAVSVEVALVTLILFLFIYLVYFRFAPKNGIPALLTPICFHFRIPYIMPVASGLLGEWYSFVSVICGTVIYYFLDGIHQNISTFNSVALAEETSDAEVKLTVALNQLIGNREMYLVVGVFAATSLIVYFVRRMSIDYAWTIAIIAGMLIQIVGLITGYAVLNIEDRTMLLLAGGLISLLICFVLEFLLMNLDYARTERVQFEDDEYYYYVRAVPKKLVATPEKTVKHFGNTASMGRKIDRGRRGAGNDEEVSRRAFAQEMDIDEDLLK